MLTVKESEAEAHFERLLDEVERGATFVITRHQRPIARLIPESVFRQQEIDQAIAGISALRSQTGRVSTSEILSARDEGHKR